jgi:hypothetical protein
MLRPRTRDLGHFGNHADPQLLIGIFLIGVMAAVLLPLFAESRPSLGALCVEQLAGSLEKGPAAGSSCPVCGQSYLVSVRGEADVLGCPAPEGHLETRPEFVRPKGEPWRLRQTLPPASGKPPEFYGWTTGVAESPGRLSVHLIPAGTTRYFWGPLGVLVLGAPALLLLGIFVKKLYRKVPDGRLACLVFAVVLGTPAWLVLRSFTSSTELIIERAGARVRLVQYRFGTSASEKIYEGCLGFVPASGAALRASKLLLIHPPDAQGRRVAEFPPLSSDHIDAVRHLNQVLTGG